MIPVQYIFEATNDLTRKNNAGYTSSAEFNRHLNQCQDMLMRYYYKLFEEAQQIVDSLFPFLVELRIPIGAKGVVTLPNDYRHRLEVGYLEVFNAGCEGGLTIKPKPMHYLAANEVIETLSSPIRKPSKAKKIYKHTFVNGAMLVYPDDLTGYVHFKYLRDPRQAAYNTTFDVVNRQQIFDPLTSIDLEWNEQDRDNIVDLLLLMKGISIRESALTQWVVQKNQYLSNKQT